MTLSAYHQKYANRTAEDITQRIRAKEYELEQIFARLPKPNFSVPTKIAVMGCGDRRFVAAHREIFEKILGHPVVITTFDITIEHLLPELGIVEWDCTEPLPKQPYDITYASVLLRFIEVEKQWNILQNSYDALDKGVAIHILDEDDYTTAGPTVPGGYNTVPLERWRINLKKCGIQFEEIPIKTGPTLESDSLALVLIKGI